jgi:tetratricopeptide (TPR) repeat protein
VTEPDRELFLAVSDTTYEDFFQRGAIRLIVERFALALLAVNIDTQEIIRWTKQFLRHSPREHPQAGNAQYLLGEALYAQWQYEAAIVALDEFVQEYSSDPKVPAAMLKQGYAFAELQNVRRARFLIQQVQKKFPKKLFENSLGVSHELEKQSSRHHTFTVTLSGKLWLSS